MDLSISYIFGEAWELAKKHGLALALFLFVLSLLGGSLSAAMMPAGFWSTYFNGINGNAHDMMRLQALTQESSITTNMSSIVSTIIELLINVGLYTSILSLCRGGKGLNIDHFKRPVNVYCKYIGVTILTGLIVFIGAIFCIIPGIYLALRLGFATLYTLDDEEASMMEALKWSWNATRGRELELLGLGLVAIVVSIVGLAICCVGVFYTLAIMMIAFTLTYLVLLENQKAIEKL